MAAVGHQSVTDPTRSDTTSSTYVAFTGKKILGSGLDANSDYLLVFYCGVGGNSTNANDFEFQIAENGVGALSYSHHRMEPRRSGTANAQVYCYMARVTTAATPNDYQIEAKSAGTNTARVITFNAVAIKLDDLASGDFAWNEDTTNNTNVSSSVWTDGASITIGNGSDDWLVIAVSHWAVQSTTDDIRQQIDVGGTAYGEFQLEGEDTVEEWSIGTIVYLAALGSSTTVKSQIRTTGNVPDCDRTAIFGLRLNAFEDHAGVRNTTPTAITATATDTVAATLTHTTSTAATRDWMFYAFGLNNVGETTKRTSRVLYENTGATTIVGDRNDDICQNGATDIVPIGMIGQLSSVTNAFSLDVDFIVQEAADVTPNPSIDTVNIACHTWELAAAGGDITRAPSAGSLALAGKTPTIAVTANHVAAPSVATLTLTGQALTVTVSDLITVAPAVAAVVLSGNAPTVAITDNHTVAPTVVAITLAGSAPTVATTANHVAAPAVAAVVLSGNAPTVATTANHVAAPAVAAVVLSGSAPTITVAENQFTSPTVGTLVLSGSVPSVSVTAHQFVSPTAGALTLAGSAPTVSRTDHHTAAPTIGALTLAGSAPAIVVTAHHVAALNEATLTLAGQQPNLGGGIFVQPAVRALSLTGQVPSAFREDTIAPAVVALTLTGEVPTLTHQYYRYPAYGFLDLNTRSGLNLNGLTPTISVGSHVISSPAAATLTLSPTTPVAFGEIFVAPAALALTLAGTAPFIGAGLLREPAVGALTLISNAPTVLVEQYRAPAVGTLTLATFAPSSSEELQISVAEYALTLSGQAPVAFQQHYRAPAAGALVLDPQTPTLGATADVTKTPATLALALASAIPSVVSSTKGEIVNINGWDAGWPGGFLTNVDDSVSFPDGSVVSTTVQNDVVVFDLDDVTDVQDKDTVLSVTITIRCKADVPSAGPYLDVALKIGGVTKNTVATATLGTSFSNEFLTDASWNADWTVAELNAAQIIVTSRATTPDGFQVWAIDASDVQINYIEAPVHNFTPDPATLTLTGAAGPTSAETGGFQSRRPQAAQPFITGYPPTLKEVIVVPVGAATFTGKVSYIDPLSQQLQIDSWDSGWPTGFVSNVDEPVSGADGQVVSTTINNDVVVFGFDDPVGIVDNDTVLRTYILVRARITGTAPDFVSASLDFELLIDGFSRGLTTLNETTLSSFVNTTVTNEDWNLDWTASQLNSIQFRVTAHGDFGATSWTWSIDSIDAYVQYSPQSPLLLIPGEASVTLQGYAPELATVIGKTPAAAILALTGTVPGVGRADTVYPGEVQRRLFKYAPIRITDFIEPIGATALTLTGATGSAIVNSIYQPSEVDLTLSTAAPTIVVTADHSRIVPVYSAILRMQKPLLQTATNQTVQGDSARGVYAGYAPTIVQTRNHFVSPARVALVLARKTPVRVNSKVRYPDVVARLLTTAAPTYSIGQDISVSEGVLLFDGKVPTTGPREALLTLATAAPSMNVTLSIGSMTLTAAGQFPIAEYRSRTPLTGELVLASEAPLLIFGTFLLSADPKLISLTTRRSIEFIGNPTGF